MDHGILRETRRMDKKGQGGLEALFPFGGIPANPRASTLHRVGAPRTPHQNSPGALRGPAFSCQRASPVEIGSSKECSLHAAARPSILSITRKASLYGSVQEFLRRLDKCGERRRRTEESGGSLELRTWTRSAPAKMKCQEGEKLLRGWTPTPRQYADAVGVSVSTVYRLLREERLSYYRPTKRRIVLCHLFHKNRNRLLTRRAQEKPRESLERPREATAVLLAMQSFRVSRSRTTKTISQRSIWQNTAHDKT